jgi:hypothetical protein
LVWSPVLGVVVTAATERRRGEARRSGRERIVIMVTMPVRY